MDVSEAGRRVYQPPVVPRRVLVVDDSKAQRLMLQLSLVRQGYEVQEAATAERALELCGGVEFDFILSNWVMPGLQGPEFCRAFRQIPREKYGYFVSLR